MFDVIFSGVEQKPGIRLCSRATLIRDWHSRALNIRALIISDYETRVNSTVPPGVWIFSLASDSNGLCLSFPSLIQSLTVLKNALLLSDFGNTFELSDESCAFSSYQFLLKQTLSTVK